MYPTVRTFYTLALRMCATHLSHGATPACLHEELFYVTTAPAQYRDNLADCPEDLARRAEGVRSTYAQPSSEREMCVRRCRTTVFRTHHARQYLHCRTGMIYCERANALLASTHKLTTIILEALAPWMAE